MINSLDTPTGALTEGESLAVLEAECLIDGKQKRDLHQRVVSTGNYQAAVMDRSPPHSPQTVTVRTPRQGRDNVATQLESSQRRKRRVLEYDRKNTSLASFVSRKQKRTPISGSAISRDAVDLFEPVVEKPLSDHLPPDVHPGAIVGKKSIRNTAPVTKLAEPSNPIAVDLPQTQPLSAIAKVDDDTAPGNSREVDGGNLAEEDAMVAEVDSPRAKPTPEELPFLRYHTLPTTEPTSCLY